MEYSEEVRERIQGKRCDIFFGMEHTLRKEEMEEQFNKEAKQGRRFAADAAIISDGIVSSEDRKHKRREEYALLSTAIWQSWVQKKEQRHQSQATRVDSGSERTYDYATARHSLRGKSHR